MPVILLVLNYGASCSRDVKAEDEPLAKLPRMLAHTDHAAFFREPFASPSDVTRRCLECHPESARQVMATSHWTWQGDEVQADWMDTPLRIGKKNMINNFCVSVASNWQRCATCHIGYGWSDASFDFADESLVDCLICHDTLGGYVKQPDGAGMPADGVDLLASAKSVGRPTRENCGNCHFTGGGGNAIKHGDMDATMNHPSARIDTHMGGQDMTCVDCHRAEDHVLAGLLHTVSQRDNSRVRCTDCHAETPHGDERLDAHTVKVACQACHIPYYALDTPTKLSWDWSAAGEESDPGNFRFDPDKHHEYLKIKGSFSFDTKVAPEYAWYDGRMELYLPGQKINPDGVTVLCDPLTGIDMDAARLMPFKLHKGRQPYDLVNQHLLTPHLFGKDGYWEEFDWDLALRLGCEASGLSYSGEYGFTDTLMYWPIHHMVQPAARSLQCTDCHGPAATRLNWEQLGYDCDPAYDGTRKFTGIRAGGEVAQ